MPGEDVLDLGSGGGLDCASAGDLSAWLREAGFAEISIGVNEASREMIRGWMPGTGAERNVASASIQAVKPA